ncbi:MAG: leucine--tRNA ligase [archaeon]
MIDFPAIEKKWEMRWNEKRIFEATPEKGKKKFFATFPYPYMNGFLHIGHFYTLMRVEAFTRFKRLTGHNVLFPQGWHCTGSPIQAAADRIKKDEPKQWESMKKQGFSDDEIKKFAEPEYWTEFFPKEAEKDYRRMGVGVDFRRQFITTSLNPQYNKFIEWQFRKLREGNYVIKGKFPVVWDPKEGCPVGDHDRVEGEGVTTKDFIWGKFRMRDSDLILMAGTTRPDAFYGQSNLWIDPEGDYVIVEVGDEKWVVGRAAVDKIKNQFAEPKVIGTITPEELIGKWVKGPLIDNEIYVLPAWFIDSKVGSGIVFSALEDPVDLYELHKIQANKDLQKNYKLTEDVVAALAPISIISVPGMGDDLGTDIGKEFGVKSDQDKEKLELAKGELNRRVFRKGVMKKNCGECAGMTVPKCQELLKRKLPEEGDAVMFYELEGKVVARSLSECVVKVVDDQWFIDYANPEWKELTKKNLKNLRLYPEKARQQFEYVIDWLHEWACTREAGLGTLLPWDNKWLIESLSDSTIYNAYYTFSHKISDIPIEQVDDELFDYILLGKGKAPIDKAEEMKAEFDYWYPVDFRNSGKDLIQNHLTFFLFNHTALFPEKHWPQGIGVNGWVTVDGEKMSKSKGNMILLREMADKFGVDTSRLTIMSGGEGLDDPNWDSEFARSVRSKLIQWHEFCSENYKADAKPASKLRRIDEWMLSKLHETVRDTAAAMEETLFRTASQKAFFDLNKAMRWYLRRSAGKPDAGIISKIIEAQVIMMVPFTPMLCEETWERMGKEGMVSQARWPESDEKLIDPRLDKEEDLLSKLMEDSSEVLRLAKINKPKKLTLFCAQGFLYDLFSLLGKAMEETRNPKDLIGKVMADPELKKHGQQVIKLIPRLVKGGIPQTGLSKVEELAALEQAKVFLAEEFSCDVVIEDGETSSEAKAKQALPGKPAILAE